MPAACWWVSFSTTNGYSLSAGEYTPGEAAQACQIRFADHQAPPPIVVVFHAGTASNARFTSCQSVPAGSQPTEKRT
jgi:hypothetical protein